MTDHRNHNHPATSAARAICRRKGPAAAATATSDSTVKGSKGKGTKSTTPTLDDRIRANRKHPKGEVKTYKVDPATLRDRAALANFISAATEHDRTPDLTPELPADA